MAHIINQLFDLEWEIQTYFWETTALLEKLFPFW